MLQPSMWTSYLIEWFPEEMVKCFAEHGWHTLELSDEHGHDLLKLGDPATVGAKFRRFAADRGVSFPQGHFYLCNKGFRPEDLAGRRVADVAPADDADFATAMDDMKRWVDLFSALGVKAGVLHIGGGKLGAAGWSQERIFARRVDAVTRIAEFAKGGPVKICIENMCDEASGVRTAADIIRYIDAVGADKAGICLDTGHANITPVDSAEFVSGAGAHLKALHIADNLGKSDDHMLPYSRGTVKWTPVMRALRAVKYDGLFNFEVPGDNRCPKPVRLAKLDYALKLANWMIENDGVE